jgi:hypothetical protein
MNAVSVGIGAYNGSQAISISGITRLQNSNAKLYGSVGYGSRAKKVGVSGGVMWSW